MSTPELQLRTLFVLDDEGRIVSLREPGAKRGPLFSLIRGATSCAWAVRGGLPRELTHELDRLARDEPPTPDLRAAPMHAERYLSLLGDRVAADQSASDKARQSDGPAFTFPDVLVPPPSVVTVEDERQLERHFQGWVPGEIAAGSGPVLAMLVDGDPVSVCFCARRGEAAAEAGVDTAEAFRGRGHAPRVTAAWALAIRATGRVPLYSTAWTNAASLAVARKLGLTAYASDWSVLD